MTTRRFTLILADLPEMTAEAANALYEAGCDDGSPGSSCGVLMVDFSREAPSLEEAIRSAVADVQRAGFQVARLEIDAEDLAHLAAHTPGPARR